MDKKYFIAFCVMDDKHLRSNAFYHSSLLFLEADTDINKNLIYPMRVFDGYGYYSHPFPNKQSLFNNPFGFLSQSLGINTRLRGSYGEWRREAIHDITYGPGLSGRLFEVNLSQIKEVATSIQTKIEYQDEFFKECKSLEEREILYTETKNKIIETLAADGLNNDEINLLRARLFPLSEFKFSFIRGHGYTCKVAALSELQKVVPGTKDYVHETINAMRIVSNSLPRLTWGLEPIITHAHTMLWRTKGTDSKFPYCDWDAMQHDTQSSLFIVDIGKYYIDSNGNEKNVPHLTEVKRRIVYDLKLVARLCEINLADPIYKTWLAKCTHYLHKIATVANRKDKICHYAGIFLDNLLTNNQFLNRAEQDTPKNLQHAMDALLDRKTTRLFDYLPSNTQPKSLPLRRQAPLYT